MSHTCTICASTNWKWPNSDAASCCLQDKTQTKTKVEQRVGSILTHGIGQPWVFAYPTIYMYTPVQWTIYYINVCNAIWYTQFAYSCSCFELPNRKLVVICRNSYAFQSNNVANLVGKTSTQSEKYEFIFLKLSQSFPNQVCNVLIGYCAVSDYMYKLHALTLTTQKPCQCVGEFICMCACM